MDGRCAAKGLPWTDFDEQALGRCVMLFIFYRLSFPFCPTFEIFFFIFFRHPRVPERSFAFVLPCHFHLPFYIQPNTNNTILCSFNWRSFDLVSVFLSLSPHISSRHTLLSHSPMFCPPSTQLPFGYHGSSPFLCLHVSTSTFSNWPDGLLLSGETVFFTYVFFFVFSRFLRVL